MTSLSLTSKLDGDGQRHAPAALPRVRTPVLIVQESGCASGAEPDEWGKPLSPQGFRTPNRAAGS